MKKDRWCRKHLKVFDFIFTSIKKNLPIDRPRDSDIFHMQPPPPGALRWLSFDKAITSLLGCLQTYDDTKDMVSIPTKGINNP